MGAGGTAAAAAAAMQPMPASRQVKTVFWQWIAGGGGAGCLGTNADI